jgi:hypothetical protein
MSETGKMFTEQAWDAGYATALTRCGPSVSRRDVEEIVSVVVNHGFEELYVDHAVSDDLVASAPFDALESLREHMRNQLAIEALKNGCVMLTLPREVKGGGEWGMTTLRLIVPVRRLAPVADAPEAATVAAEPQG